MLAALIRGSLRAPWLVMLLATAALLFSGISALRGKYDVFPEFVPPIGEVQTEAPGLVAEQVERLITQPLEDAINGTEYVEAVRSESIAGLSVITVSFEASSDPFRDRQLLAERIAEVSSRLPAVAGTPKINPMTSSTMDMLKIGLLSERQSPMQLRTLADRVIAPRLQSVPGVAAVHVFGGQIRELQVHIDPRKLAAYGLALDAVRQAAADAIGQRGGGFIDTANQRVLLQSTQRSPNAADIGATVIAQRGGRGLRLADVADIVEGPAPAFGDARLQGRPGILLALLSQYGSNTLEVTRATEVALDELRPLLAAQGVTLTPPSHRPANFIEAALANMRAALLTGAVLVLVVLSLCLRNWRTALISFLSIPLSLLAAVFVMLRFGWTINTMTLGGLAVAVGLVVDDAIIDVENIVRRLRQTASTATPQARSAVILAASLEVRRPVVLATLIVGLVFVPILLLGGLQGRFFAPLAAAFLLATLASLVVALTVTPALCLLLLRPGAIKQTQARWLRRLKLLQDRVLRRLRPHAVSLLIATLLLGAVSVVALTRFGAELLPAFREGHYVLQVSSQSGTSLAQMMRIGETLSAEILAIDGVQSVSQQAGRASNAEDTWPTNQSEFHVELRPGLSAARQGRIEARLHELLQSYPGIQFEVLTFLGDRIGESLGGEAAPLTVNIFGPDLDTLDTLAARAATLLRSLPAAGEVAPDTLVEAPTIQLQLDPRRLAIQGLRPAEVLADVETAGQGTVVGEIYDGTQPIAVRVLLDAAAGRDPETLGALPLHGPAGIVRLQDVASVDVGTSRSSVLHEGGRRRQLINVTPATADIVGFAAAAQRLLAQQLTLPAGYYIEFAGAAAGARGAQRDLLWQSAFAAAGIVALLAFAFPDRRSLLLILANLPFALTGGALAVALSGGLLSIGALIGFVTLFGICARNTIMLLAHYEHLVSAEGARWNRFTALRGARERLAPIVMTAAVTALGLLPLAIGGSEAGREVEAPMALVILGGLVSSTLLNLLVMPVLAARWLRPRGTPDQPIAAS